MQTDTTQREIVEIQVEDVAEESVVEVYLMRARHVCADQQPFHYLAGDRNSRSKARRAALARARELEAEHGCPVSWNW